MEPVEEGTISGGRRTTVEAVPVSFEGVRVSWGGVWSGFLLAIGILLLLSTLGLAIGITAANLGPDENLNAGGLGMGAAIWSGISLLIALFFGGWMASRAGVVFDKMAGCIEGALVWVLSMIAIIYLATSGISLVASGAFTFLSGVTGSVAAAIQSAPQLDQLFTGDISQTIARLNDPETTRTIAAATGMSQEEVQNRLAELRARVEAVQENPAEAAAVARQGLQNLLAQAGQRAERAVAAAQPYATGALWTTLIVMVLSLIAALLGSTVGANRAAARVGINHRGLATAHS